LYPVPDVRINPKTAAEYGIKHGDWIEISSARTQGEVFDPVAKTGTKTAEPIKGRAYVAEVVAPNVLWMERFWNPECFDNSQKKKTGGWQECNINVITNAINPHYNEVFGSYTNRGFAVNIKKTTKPDNIWVNPKEFAPFLPSADSQYHPDLGKVIDSPITPIVTFPDGDPGAMPPAGGGA
jgi:anaerobic selenocysteine-containing dehydrogenase